MKYDKSLKNKEDKKFWDYLMTGIFEDVKEDCIYRMENHRWTMKQIIDDLRPVYGSCDGDVNISGMGIFDIIRMKDRLEKAAIKILN